jgi:hypothetical protein
LIKYTWFTIEARTNQRKIENDENRMASPNNAIKTPEIMGFRTYRYRPVTTICFVGAQGARVPSPILENIRMQMIKRATPMIIRAKPREDWRMASTRSKLHHPGTYSFETTNKQAGITINTPTGRLKEPM